LDHAKEYGRIERDRSEKVAICLDFFFQIWGFRAHFAGRHIKDIDAIRTGIIMLRLPPSTPRHFIRDDRETGQNPHRLIASVRVYTYGAA
jgi:hypothetical protein